MTDKYEKKTRGKPSLWSLVLSTLAAAIGVQRKSNLEQDFSQTSPMPYIIAGVVFTVAFVFILITIVHFVLKGVG